jgi:hypothetical protein
LWEHLPAHLDDIKLLIQRYPEHAAGLTPGLNEFGQLRSLKEVKKLIDLTLCCHQACLAIKKPGTFDIATLFKGFEYNGLRGEDLASAVLHLLCCYQLSSEPGSFDPTFFLTLFIELAVIDQHSASVVQKLFLLGARVELHHFEPLDDALHFHSQVIQVLRSHHETQDQVKEPGME